MQITVTGQLSSVYILFKKTICSVIHFLIELNILLLLQIELYPLHEKLILTMFNFTVTIIFGTV